MHHLFKKCGRLQWNNKTFKSNVTVYFLFLFFLFFPSKCFPLKLRSKYTKIYWAWKGGKENVLSFIQLKHKHTHSSCPTTKIIRTHKQKWTCLVDVDPCSAPVVDCYVCCFDNVFLSVINYLIFITMSCLVLFTNVDLCTWLSLCTIQLFNCLFWCSGEGQIKTLCPMVRWL